MSHTTAEVVKKAIENLDGPTETARRLTEKTGKKVSQQRVWYWKEKGIVPGEFAIPLAQLNDDPDITPHTLCPEVHPHQPIHSDG